jgi:hypothetical protein
VLALRAINRAFRRHRRVVALLGAIVMLGVIALNAHAALPAHHDGTEEICLCASSIAVAIAFGWCSARPFSAAVVVLRPGRLELTESKTVACGRVSGIARAGPARQVVLRR